MELTLREKIVVWTLRLLSLSFAVVGLLFVLFPAQTLGVTDTLGRRLGSFAPAPVSEQRFWLTLAFAYMVLVTALAGLAAQDVRANRNLLPVLALGKLASSLTALGFFLLDRPVFIYLLNFVVDGGIVIVVIACLWLLKRWESVGT